MPASDILELTPAHPDFPIAARAMSTPPDRLYLRGRLPQSRSIALVGTRRASAPALRFTREFAAQVCCGGWSVWSGGALGIDTAAHEGALEAGGLTVVVMGTGFDQLYPAGNIRLFERVLEHGGAWLSPFPPEQPGSRWTFLARNELLAALVDDVAVVQAPMRSGARSTVASARRLGKRVWATPASPWDPMGAGSLAELVAGASVLLGAEQIVGRLKRPRQSRRSALPDDLTRSERAVAQAVARAPAGLDAICDRTGLPVSEVASAALMLTLRGLLVEGADGSYHRVRG